MSDDTRQLLAEAQQTIQALEDELAETNRGLVALTLELEQRVDERTAELRAAHAELEKTNSELLQLALELEGRVAQRTTELQTRSEEIRAMSQQLWQTAKLATVGELAASIAHELNNPMATVSLRVESLLAQIPPDDPKRKPLEVIDQEVERMGNLVANLLQFSRRSHQQVSTLNVCGEIDQTLELIRYQLRNRRIDIVRAFDSGVPLIHADRQHLRQLFLNLFTNASDAMAQGGTLTLRVQCGILGDSTLAVVIEVVDTGSGIAPEHLPHVLEPFFTTKAEGKGTGLGLAICRRVVQEHHGTLELTSAVGQGTTVCIVLPVAAVDNGAHLREP